MAALRVSYKAMELGDVFDELFDCYDLDLFERSDVWKKRLEQPFIEWMAEEYPAIAAEHPDDARKLERRLRKDEGAAVLADFVESLEGRPHRVALEGLISALRFAGEGEGELVDAVRELLSDHE